MDYKAIFQLHANADSRLKWVDYAKGIAIILVVYRHLLIGINRSGLAAHEILMQANEVVYTFRMPLFFILSGIFIRKGIQKRSVAKFINSKFETIIYPYLIWATLQVTIQILLTGYINADRTWVDYTYIFTRPRSIDQFWFLYALFNTAMLYLLSFKLLKGNRYMLLAVGVALQGLFMVLSHIPVLNDVLQYFFYMAVGDFCAGYLLDKQHYKKLSSLRLTLLLLPFFVIAQWVYFSQGEHVNIFLLTVIALTGSTLMFNLSFVMARYDVLGFFPFVGNYSLQVYLMHAMVGAASRVFFVKFVHLTQVPLLLGLGWVLAVLIPIFFYRFCMMSGFWWLFQPKKPASAIQRKTVSASQ